MDTSAKLYAAQYHLQKLAESIQKELEEYQKHIKPLEEEIDALKEKLRVCENMRREIDDLRAKLHDYDDMCRRLDELRFRMSKVDRLTRSFEKYTQNSQVLSQELQQLLEKPFSQAMQDFDEKLWHDFVVGFRQQNLMINKFQEEVQELLEF